jgi:hypothetical protein
MARPSESAKLNPAHAADTQSSFRHPPLICVPAPAA